jgi:hypothetical protein
MGNLALPPLSMFAARSTYLILVPALVMLANAVGFDILGSLGFADQSAFVDGIMEFIGALMLVLGFGQRLAPNFRLNLSGK